MSNSQTIEEKKLAAEVYAQRLAYISVTGKEPDANDTITHSGYLNCWNEAIAAVGDPFTDSGQTLLARLQEKAVFHGQKQLYHNAFPPFFFRVLYTTFVKTSTFAELGLWQELDFNHELPCPPSGVMNWLEKCLHDQSDDLDDAIGKQYFVEMLNWHAGATTQILTICSEWAASEDESPTSSISVQELPSSISSNLQHKQAAARLAVEREIYQKLFFTDPGEWSVENYLSGISRSLSDPYEHSDLLAVKLCERYPVEAGWWGYTYDANGGKAIYDNKRWEAYDNDMNRLISNDLICDYDIGDVDKEIILNHLYHPDFLPIFLEKMGVSEQDIGRCWSGDIRWLNFEPIEGWHIKAGTPRRIENTARWIGLTYEKLCLEDWQHFLSILNSAAEAEVAWWDVEHNNETQERIVVNYSGKIRKRYPTVQRAIDYAKFKVATMPASGQPLLPSPTSHRQLAAPKPEVLSIEAQTLQHPTLGLTWQGPRTEFVELACALYEAGAITMEGPGGRDAAVERLGNALGINGKTPVSTVLQDIKNKRNGDRQTPLLDRLKTKFLDYLGK